MKFLYFLINSSSCLFLMEICPRVSNGLNSCPTKLLKCVRDIVSKPPASILSLSVTEGVYSTKPKLTKIVPVFKSNDKYDPNNYWPISCQTSIEYLKNSCIPVWFPALRNMRFYARVSTVFINALYPAWNTGHC